MYKDYSFRPDPLTNMAATGNSPLSQIKWLLPSMLKYNMYFYLYIFSSPGQRPSELLPSLGVCRPSVVRRKLSHFNLLLRNHWANCNQTLVEWSLDGSLPKLCPVIPTSNQDGHQAKNRKKGG
jgi:hypothetical protein